MIDIKENKAMRIHLTMISLSPIFFLTGIKYYDPELIGFFRCDVHNAQDEVWHIVITLLSAIWGVVSLVLLLMSIIDNKIVNKCVYSVLGINMDGYKEILGTWIFENESASFYTSICAG